MIICTFLFGMLTLEIQKLPHEYYGAYSADVGYYAYVSDDFKADSVELFDKYGHAMTYEASCKLRSEK